MIAAPLVRFGFALLLAAAALSPLAAAADVEEPKFDLIQRDGDIEIRRYPAIVIANTVQPGDRDDSSGPAFRRLADYIFEEDRPEGEIEMTAPVIMAPAGGDATSMAFVMPERFDLETLPTPSDPNISLDVIPARTVAAITFSGWAGDRDLAEEEAELRSWMAAQGLEPQGAAEWAFYNPPWTLGPWRRNEVLIEVAE